MLLYLEMLLYRDQSLALVEAFAREPFERERFGAAAGAS